MRGGDVVGTNKYNDARQRKQIKWFWNDVHAEKKQQWRWEDVTTDTDVAVAENLNAAHTVLMHLHILINEESMEKDGIINRVCHICLRTGY